MEVIFLFILIQFVCIAYLIWFVRREREERFEFQTAIWKVIVEMKAEIYKRNDNLKKDKI